MGALVDKPRSCATVFPKGRTVAKIVHPERRMRDEHPWTIFNIIRHQQMLLRLTGRFDAWITPVDIGKALYSNWDALSVRDYILVTEAKITFPLRFLKVNHYISERLERPGSRSPDWAAPQPMDEYQARTLLSPDIAKTIGPDAAEICKAQMDKTWGKWIGRKEFDISKYLVDDE